MQVDQSATPSVQAADRPIQPNPASQLALYARAFGGADNGLKAMETMRKLSTPQGVTLQPGMMWDTQNPGHAIPVPGELIKGANGEILSTDANGKPLQTVPQNPVAKSKFETNLQQIAAKFDQLQKLGGTVEEGNSFLSNKATQLAASDDMHLPEWMGGGSIPGGQTLLQGTPTQSLRDDIEALTKQTLPFYMQANGITPGMERAQSAQEMLLNALGGAVGKSHQHILSNLASLSAQSGTGELAQRIGSANPDLYTPAQTSVPQSALAQVAQQSQPGSITPAMAQAELARRAKMRGQ